MSRKLILVWSFVFVLGILTLLGYEPALVAFASNLNDDDPPLVITASPDELEFLSSAIRPRLEEALDGFPGYGAETSTSGGDRAIDTIALRRLFFDQERRLVVDLGESAYYPSAAAFQPLGDYIIATVSDELHEHGYSSNWMSYYFQIQGVGVEDVFRPFLADETSEHEVGGPDISSEDLSSVQMASSSLSSTLAFTTSLFQPDTGISGHRVAINPGHGYFDNSGSWAYSGALVGGVQEDNLNHDMAVRLNQALNAVGANVVSLREFDRSPSYNAVYKWWEMGTREYARQRLNQPSWVWNTASSGTNRDKDINARPFLAAVMNAELMVGIHNNSSVWPLWGAEWCGTLVIFDNSNSRQSQSQLLADRISSQIATLQSSYNWWCGVEVRGRNDNGENTYFYGPAVLIEVGNLQNGNVRTRLQDPGFQQAAMNSIRDGIRNYYQSLPANCPTAYTWRVEYWSNSTLNGTPALCQNETSISHDWGYGGPTGLPTDRFALRATSTRYFAAGNYRFYLGGDDGIRLWIDGDLRINQWRDQGYTQYHYDMSLSAGNHSIMVEYYENTGNATIRFWWEQASSCSGQYRAEYFNNKTLTGNPTYVVCEGWPINHDWGNSGPGNGIGNDNFSTRWTGRANFGGGSYTFIARADDGIRVWLDNNLIINEWRDQPATEFRRTLNVNSGEHAVKVEYYENGGGAVAQFRWEQATACTDNAQFVTQSQYPTVQPGQSFQIFFEVRNTGTCTWRQSNDYYLGNGNNTPLGANPRQELGGDVAPNATKRWTINMTAPTAPGTYRTQWMIKHGNQTFGPNMFIDVTVPSSSGGNLALNSPAYATSQESSSYSPERGNDGSTSTRWSSRVSSTLGDEWWWVDLGTRTFDRVVIRWEAAYAAQYFVGWSDNAVNFTGYWYTRTAPGNYSHDLGSRTARYIGIAMHTRAPQMNNYSFWEAEVYRTASQAFGGDDLVLDAPDVIEIAPDGAIVTLDMSAK